MDNKIAQRFWDKVKIGDGCWEWQAGKRKHGYGSFRTDKGPQKAHRVAYELWHGTDPSNKNVLHLCGNPACCRPDHLVLGDQKENMRHMKEHGRSLIGHKNHATKLTEAQVLDIRSSSLTQQQLANIYGVARSLISMIKTRKVWTHI